MDHKNEKLTLRDVQFQEINKTKDLIAQDEKDEKEQKKYIFIKEYRKKIGSIIRNFEDRLEASAKEGNELEVPIMQFICEISTYNESKTYSTYEISRRGYSYDYKEVTYFHGFSPVNVKDINSEIIEQNSNDLKNIRINDEKIKELYSLISSNDFVPVWFTKVIDTGVFSVRNGCIEVPSLSRNRSFDIQVRELCLRADSSRSYKALLEEQDKIFQLKKEATEKNDIKHPMLKLIIGFIILIFLFSII